MVAKMRAADLFCGAGGTSTGLPLADLDPKKAVPGAGYKITGNRTEQVRQIGNAVEVYQARALGTAILEAA